MTIVGDIYRIIQVKYALKSRNSTSVEVFRNGDFKYDEVNPKIVSNSASSARRYKKKKESNRSRNEGNISLYRKNEVNMKSRAEQIRMKKEAEKIARIAHQRVMKRKLRMEKLTNLVKRRKTDIHS